MQLQPLVQGDTGGPTAVQSGVSVAVSHGVSTPQSPSEPTGFTGSPPRIRIEVRPGRVPDRIGLQEPPQRQRIGPSLVVIGPEARQPHLAGILKPPDVARAEIAVLIVGVDGGADARRAIDGVDQAAPLVPQPELRRRGAGGGVAGQDLVHARAADEPRLQGIRSDRREPGRLGPVIEVAPEGAASQFIEAAERAIAERRGSARGQAIGAVIGEALRRVVGDVARNVAADAGPADAHHLVAAVVGVGSRVRRRPGWTSAGSSSGRDARGLKREGKVLLRSHRINELVPLVSPSHALPSWRHQIIG